LNRDILIDDIRVRGIGKGFCHEDGANLGERKAGSLEPINVIPNLIKISFV
jgi:hypothetical protein